MAQNTRIIIGSANAEVALHKASGPPPSVNYDTMRVVDGETSKEVVSPLLPSKHTEADPHAIEPDDPFGESGDCIPEEPPAVPVTRLLHGVRMSIDKFVDLTEEFVRIDERTRIDGMTVEATLRRERIPWHQARDSYYIAPTSPEAAEFMAHVWHGLYATGLVALVRFSKRTGHYLGVIVAEGRRTLSLVELEWPANMRSVPENCYLDVADVPESGVDAAIEAMNALQGDAKSLSDMRDERMTQRAELITTTRAGKKWSAPKPTEPSPAVEELGDVLLAAVSR